MDITVGDVAKYLNRSPTTIRVWTEEFEQFLSPKAVGGDGRTRRYSVEDIAVLKLVADMRDENRTSQDILVALHRGDRGYVEDLDMVKAIAAVVEKDQQAVSLKLQYTERELQRVTAKLEEALEELKSNKAIREENIRLKAERNAEVRYMQNRLKDMQQTHQQQLRQMQAFFQNELGKRDQRLQSRTTELDALRMQIAKLQVQLEQSQAIINQWNEYYQSTNQDDEDKPE